MWCNRNVYIEIPARSAAKSNLPRTCQLKTDSVFNSSWNLEFDIAARSNSSLAAAIQAWLRDYMTIPAT
jgi:hypothetical protein